MDVDSYAEISSIVFVETTFYPAKKTIKMATAPK